MIQRIQSVYLLLATIALVIALCMPAGYFVGGSEAEVYPFRPLGVMLAEGSVQSTWGLFGILLLSALIACCTIFLFRNRQLQMRMTVFNGLLLIGYYVAFSVFVYVLKGESSFTFQIGWALCLPLVSIILNYLAFCAIRKDDKMVRDAYRLRK